MRRLFCLRWKCIVTGLVRVELAVLEVVGAAVRVSVTGNDMVSRDIPVCGRRALFLS